jgi:4-hydroxy-2-oxoheptanedioate aldolase
MRELGDCGYDPLPVHINRVKQALKQGKSAFGCSCLQFRSPDVIRALAAAGLDWAFLDSEHGAFDLETLNDMMRVAVREGFCPIVRVADLQYPLIARALDSGAQGILLPRVESPELLEKAISWTRYPPMGVRGYGLSAAHLEFESVSMADAIAHFSIALGIPGQFEHASFVAAVERIRDECDRRGIAPGLHLRSLQMARRWRNQGLRFLSCNSDIGYLLEKATEVAGVLKGQID